MEKEIEEKVEDIVEEKVEDIVEEKVEDIVEEKVEDIVEDIIERVAFEKTVLDRLGSIIVRLDYIETMINVNASTVEDKLEEITEETNNDDDNIVLNIIDNPAHTIAETLQTTNKRNKVDLW